MTLADYNVLGTGSFTKRLEEFHTSAKEWSAQCGQYLHMTALTKDQLGMDTMADFPAASL